MKKKILLIENDLYIRSLLKIHLESSKYDVYVAIDLNGALQKCKIHKPDIIILDLFILKYSDFNDILEVRKKPLIYGQPKILGISKSIDENFIESSLKKLSELDSFFIQPFEFETFIKTVNKLTSQKSLTQKQKV